MKKLKNADISATFWPLPRTTKKSFFADTKKMLGVFYPLIFYIDLYDPKRPKRAHFETFFMFMDMSATFFYAFPKLILK